VYSKAQEQLAGRDGIEAFRTVFRERATLVVILYGRPWGETPWTRVEQSAIEELALERGWEHLMFVRLNAVDPVPKWVPKPHLRLDLATFSLRDLVGAIKSRLVELGVEAKPLTPADRAAAQQRQRLFDLETERLLRNGTVDFDAAFHDLLAAIELEAGAIAEASGWKVQAGAGALIGGFIVSAQNQGIQIVSGRRALNSVDDAELHLREYDCGLTVALPGHSYWPTGPIEIVGSRRLPLRRLPELGWCWEFDGQVLPMKAMAETILHVLLDRIDAAKDR
jgi:hypothetical protein